MREDIHVEMYICPVGLEVMVVSVLAEHSHCPVGRLHREWGNEEMPVRWEVLPCEAQIPF